MIVNSRNSKFVDINLFNNIDDFIILHKKLVLTYFQFQKVVGTCIGELALYLKPLSSGNQKTGNSITLSRPMQRKLVALVHCQLAEPVGRARALRAARSLGMFTEIVIDFWYVKYKNLDM